MTKPRGRGQINNSKYWGEIRLAFQNEEDFMYDLYAHTLSAFFQWFIFKTDPLTSVFYNADFQ